MNPEELLAHADFMRGLARMLVFDEHMVDDVAQQAYLVALEQPPGTLRSPRGWLATVTRNLKKRWYRTEERWSFREQVVSFSEEGVPSTVAVVQREETRRRVVEAVLALDEPHRCAVLLKFYEDLSTRDVAKRLNVKYETVRGRIRRGLEKLRERLDADFGGDRDAWCLALLPMAGLKLYAILNTVSMNAGPAASHSTASTSTPSGTTTASTATVAGMSLTSLLTGVFLMGTKAKIFALLLLVAVTGAGLWIFMPEDSRSSDREPSVISQTETADVSAMKNVEENTLALAQSEDDEPGSRRQTSAAKELITSPSMFVAGRVTDLTTGEPVTDYSISGSMIFDGGGNYAVINERIQDEEGRFYLTMPRRVRPVRYLG